MKAKMILCLLVCLCASLAMNAASVKKVDLRVLYVGGSSDYMRESFANEADFQKSVRERMASFEQLLNTYFTSVTVITADKYTQKMSENYDVTVMDGTPKVLVPEYIDMVQSVYKKAGYLTEDFNCPMLTIGELSSTLGGRIGCKNDWYCLCLDADAHSWKKEHPIFQGPFPVRMTVVEKPMPEDAFHYAYECENEIPEKLPMWKVQTKGYSSESGFRVGLISRWEDYEDGIETEFISGGVSSKSLKGVAIGRHANFFHWGFAASPAYMTDEAKNVFANAVVYISRFKGQKPIIRKYIETISTRASLKMLQHMSSLKGYEEMVEMHENSVRAVAEIVKKAQEKQAKGETLTESESMYLNMPPMKMRSREEILSQIFPRYFAMFGTDAKAYEAFFRENKDYFYGGDGTLEMTVDQDAKSVGIPNNDLRLIDAAIRMLETGKDVAKGNRLLLRYTLVDFSTPAEWRAWFEKNKSKMFFSEAGGWIFLINSHEPGVNDYKGKEIRDMQEAIQVAPTDDNNPVAIAVTKKTLQSGEQMVFVKMKIQPRYRIYARLAPGAPFTSTKVDIKLPDGYERAGEMIYPVAAFYNQSGNITVYENTAVFRLPIKGAGKGTLECTVSYQSCNDQICFPPTEQKFSVELN